MNTSLIAQARKAVAALAALAGVVTAAIADGHVTAPEAGAIGAAALGVVGVFSLRNEQRGEDAWAQARATAARFGFRLPAVAVADVVDEPAEPTAAYADDDPDELDLDGAPEIEVDLHSPPVARANL